VLVGSGEEIKIVGVVAIVPVSPHAEIIQIIDNKIIALLVKINEILIPAKLYSPNN
jgi:hypothetical protein